MPRISPACSLKRDVPVGAGRATGRPPRAATSLAEGLLQRLAIVLGLQAAADHQVMQPGDVGLAGLEVGDDGAVLHDIDAVGELQHLVEPVRDEDEGGARLQRPHAREQDLDLGAFENRGRLVEQDDQMAAGVLLERQRLGELDHLARGEIEVVGAHARIDVDLDLGELARGRRVERAPVDDAEAGELRLVAEIDVLADGQVGQQRLLLEHHADALAVGVGRVERAGSAARRSGSRRQSG